MKARLSAWLTALTVIAALALPGRVAAAPAPSQYVAIDVGTLGGPSAYPDEPGRIVTNNGIVVGSAETPALNPLGQFPQDCPEASSSPKGPCHVIDAFEWQKGVITDLGTLGGYNAGLFEINGAGIGVGIGETGVLDPLTGFPVAHAAISRQGRLIDLGTLGGNESWASGINDQGEVAGFAANTVLDPYAQFLSPYPSATQWRAVLWQDGRIQDLGTLGGPDSIGGLLNERGQAAGESFTNSTPNSSTGLPTMDPFLWQNGHMQDLGSLGGTFGIANWMNNRGEVVGQSNLAGDQTAHPFLWNASRLVDLGTLGGDNGAANWVNDAGEVVGIANLPGPPGSQVHHGFLWTNGRMTDLPPVDGAPCSNAININDRGQVAGNATDCHGNELAAILWENGVAYDLNKLIAPSVLDLITAEYVNDRGEILCRALLPNGDNRVVLVVPAALAASEGLTSTAPAPGAARPGAVTHMSPVPCALLPAWRARPIHGFHRGAC